MTQKTHSCLENFLSDIFFKFSLLIQMPRLTLLGIYLTNLIVNFLIFGFAVLGFQFSNIFFYLSLPINFSYSKKAEIREH